jgi:hypothetical protein
MKEVAIMSSRGAIATWRSRLCGDNRVKSGITSLTLVMTRNISFMVVRIAHENYHERSRDDITDNLL